MSTRTPRSLLAAATLAIALLTFGLANPGAAGAWLTPGPETQSINPNGEWEYGFWNARVRSKYYKPDICHGSTVVLDGNQQRSQPTPAGAWSNASIGAYQHRTAHDEYYYRDTCN